jgi:hypothetical protein
MSLAALDLYLSTAPLPELLAYAAVAFAAIFLGPTVSDHVSAYRLSVREA